VILHPSNARSSFNSFTPWRLTHQADDVWLWQLKGDYDVVGTLRTTMKVRSLNWNKIQLGNYFKKFESDKKRFLSLMGISHWKAKKYKWIKRKKYYELKVQGSYTNSSAENINFIEHHLFLKNHTYQILFTSPKRRKISRKISGHFVNQIKAMVLKP